jgi:hypothetical protein
LLNVQEEQIHQETHFSSFSIWLSLKCLRERANGSISTAPICHIEWPRTDATGTRSLITTKNGPEIKLIIPRTCDHGIA